MIGVFIAGIFNSFLLWCFLLLTYYRGYEYFIYNKIRFWIKRNVSIGIFINNDNSVYSLSVFNKVQ